MLNTFSLSSNLSIQKSPTAEIIGIYKIGRIVRIEYIPIISAVELFCIDKFEDNQPRKCSTFFRMSKLAKPNFINMSLIKCLTSSFSVERDSKIKFSSENQLFF